jgi:hypothetical protein
MELKVIDGEFGALLMPFNGKGKLRGLRNPSFLIKAGEAEERDQEDLQQVRQAGQRALPARQ